MKKLIILDFTNGDVYITNYDEESYDVEDYIIEILGLSPNNCQWMVAMENLNIKII